MPSGRTFALVLVVPVAIALTAVRAPAQSASPAVRDAARHVVMLRGFDAAGRVTAQGSGFYFGPGRIATNYHVIEGAATVRIIGADGDTLAATTFAEVADVELDLAILPAPEGHSGGLWIETLYPDVGDRVWAYGSPKGLSGTMTDGIVSAVRERNGRNVLQISAPISPGSSGGPVLDAHGRVLGVTVSSVRGGQNLNFAVPGRELARLGARRGTRVDFPIGTPRRDTASEHVVGPRPTLPERWEFLARSASDVEQYYDRVSLAERDDRLRVWIYSRFPETLMAGEAAFDATQALFEFRCDRQEFRLNQYLLLRGEEVIGSDGSVSSGSWSAVAPDSIAEGLATRLCASVGVAQEDEGDSPDVESAESEGDSSGV
ncbi:MAG: S1C family serine protease, partial [Gemmatimonadota bacterium]